MGETSPQKSPLKNNKMSLRLSSEVKARLEEIAREEFRSLSQQVEKFIMEGIERYEKGKK